MDFNKSPASASSGSLSSVSLSSSTDCVEEYHGDAPFAGEFYSILFTFILFVMLIFSGIFLDGRFLVIFLMAGCQLWMRKLLIEEGIQIIWHKFIIFKKSPRNLPPKNALHSPIIKILNFTNLLTSQFHSHLHIREENTLHSHSLFVIVLL